MLQKDELNLPYYYIKDDEQRQLLLWISLHAGAAGAPDFTKMLRGAGGMGDALKALSGAGGAGGMGGMGGMGDLFNSFGGAGGGAGGMGGMGDLFNSFGGAGGGAGGMGGMGDLFNSFGGAGGMGGMGEALAKMGGGGPGGMADMLKNITGGGGGLANLMGGQTVMSGEGGKGGMDTILASLGPMLGKFGVDKDALQGDFLSKFLSEGESNLGGGSIKDLLQQFGILDKIPIPKELLTMNISSLLGDFVGDKKKKHFMNDASTATNRFKTGSRYKFHYGLGRRMGSNRDENDLEKLQEIARKAEAAKIDNEDEDGNQKSGVLAMEVFSEVPLTEGLSPLYEPVYNYINSTIYFIWAQTVLQEKAKGQTQESRATEQVDKGFQRPTANSFTQDLYKWMIGRDDSPYAKKVLVPKLIASANLLRIQPVYDQYRPFIIDQFLLGPNLEMVEQAAYANRSRRISIDTKWAPKYSNNNSALSSNKLNIDPGSPLWDIAMSERNVSAPEGNLKGQTMLLFENATSNKVKNAGKKVNQLPNAAYSDLHFVQSSSSEEFDHEEDDDGLNEDEDEDSTETYDFRMGKDKPKLLYERAPGALQYGKANRIFHSEAKKKVNRRKYKDPFFKLKHKKYFSYNKYISEAQMSTTSPSCTLIRTPNFVIDLRNEQVKYLGGKVHEYVHDAIVWQLHDESWKKKSWPPPPMTKKPLAEHKGNTVMIGEKMYQDKWKEGKRKVTFLDELPEKVVPLLPKGGNNNIGKEKLQKFNQRRYNRVKDRDEPSRLNGYKAFLDEVYQTICRDPQVISPTSKLENENTLYNLHALLTGIDPEYHYPQMRNLYFSKRNKDWVMTDDFEQNQRLNNPFPVYIPPFVNHSKHDTKFKDLKSHSHFRFDNIKNQLHNFSRTLANSESIDRPEKDLLRNKSNSDFGSMYLLKKNSVKDIFRIQEHKNVPEHEKTLSEPERLTEYTDIKDHLRKTESFPLDGPGCIFEAQRGIEGADYHHRKHPRHDVISKKLSKESNDISERLEGGIMRLAKSAWYEILCDKLDVVKHIPVDDGHRIHYTLMILQRFFRQLCIVWLGLVGFGWRMAVYEQEFNNKKKNNFTIQELHKKFKGRKNAWSNNNYYDKVPLNLFLHDLYYSSLSRFIFHLYTMMPCIENEDFQLMNQVNQCHLVLESYICKDAKLQFRGVSDVLFPFRYNARRLSRCSMQLDLSTLTQQLGSPAKLNDTEESILYLCRRATSDAKERDWNLKKYHFDGKQNKWRHFYRKNKYMSLGYGLESLQKYANPLINDTYIGIRNIPNMPWKSKMIPVLKHLKFSHTSDIQNEFKCFGNTLNPKSFADIALNCINQFDKLESSEYDAMGNQLAEQNQLALQLSPKDMLFQLLFLTGYQKEDIDELVPQFLPWLNQIPKRDNKVIQPWRKWSRKKKRLIVAEDTDEEDEDEEDDEYEYEEEEVDEDLEVEKHEFADNEEEIAQKELEEELQRVYEAENDVENVKKVKEAV